MNVKTIFDPVPLGRGVTLKNRLCRSATVEGLCAGGDIGPDTVAVYRRLAEGGVGLIVSGMTEVSPSGRYLDSIAVAWKDDYAAHLRPICEAARANGAVFVVQLSHSGFKARALPNPLLAPSVLEHTAPGVTTRAATREELKRIVDDFAAAARKAQLAGADGVQLHNAHGYLLSAFFSPYANRRDDEYGGSLERRARLITEVYDAVRQTTGERFLIGVKTNCADLISPSVTPDDCVWLLRRLGARGLDFAELSAGLIPGDEPLSRFLPLPAQADEPIFYPAAKYIAAQVELPVWSVCGWRDPAVMDRCLNESRLTGISMCTPFIREPALVRRWQSGDRSPARCTSCLACEAPTRYAARCLAKPAHLPPITWFGCPVERAQNKEATK